MATAVHIENCEVGLFHDCCSTEITPEKKTVKVHTLYCLPTPQYIKPSLLPRPLPDFACTLTERDRESSRLKVSASKQVSAPGPLSSKRLTARTTTAR